MDNDWKVQQLNRSFNSQLDKDVLLSVLEICGGDVRAATDFLRSQNEGDFIDPGTQPQQNQGGTNENLPKDYMKKPSNYQIPKPMAPDVSLNAAARTKNLLLNETAFQVHLNEQNNNYGNYLAVLLLLLSKNVTMPTTTKAPILAAALSRRDWPLSDYLLKTQNEEFGFVELLRALKTLDAPRRLRSLENRLQNLVAAGNNNTKILGGIRSKMNDIKKDFPGADTQKTSLSGSLAKRICSEWCPTLKKIQLDFFLIQMPKELWRELTDLIHASPSDFVACPYFLPVVFNHPAPQDSVVHIASILTPQNLERFLCDDFQYEIPFSFLRKQFTPAQLSTPTAASVYLG
eukprot:TRINITY_DN603_c6_g1_i3.p1 TRINITY_DN603_c6_g1~~TRINITY_DN603_c6_g1_i3.p1  ORF type:complete len:346 (+),score=71.00 TRINITY_DN603_c6_g1_i3:81-1118(+)